MSPRNERIYVVKGGERIGPYSVDELLERVDRGELLYEDFCLRQGDQRHVPVREVLDWSDEEWRAAGWCDGEEDDDDGEWLEDDEDEDGYDGGEDDDEEEEAWPEPTPRPARRAGRPLPDDPAARLFSGYPALLSYPKSLLLILVALVQGIVLWNHNGWYLFGGLLVALVASSGILVMRSMRHYLITPRRVEIVHGFLAKNSHEVRIEDIRAINVKKPGFIGLLGVGDVEFASAGGDDVEVVFSQVARPEAIKGLVRRLQDRG